MKILFFNGGLGNQAFQYIFYRFLEEYGGDDIYFDDSYFFNHKGVHNGYELNRLWGLKPNLLSEYFDADVWEEILRITKNDMHILEFLNANGLNFTGVSEANCIATTSFTKQYTQPYTSVAINEYHPEIYKMQGNIYFHGYWINGNYFKELRDKMLTEMAFSEFEEEANIKYAEQIKSCNSVGVHIRRGDFVRLGWDMSPDWYKSHLPQMRRSVFKPTFFIFSDDLAWCKENLKNLGFEKSDKLVFIRGNDGEKSYRDLQLLSLCKHMMIANSSFSYLAALLNQNPHKIVANPTNRLIV
jgi:hypothetical protein